MRFSGSSESTVTVNVPSSVATTRPDDESELVTVIVSPAGILSLEVDGLRRVVRVARKVVYRAAQDLDARLSDQSPTPSSTPGTGETEDPLPIPIAIDILRLNRLILIGDAFRLDDVHHLEPFDDEVANVQARGHDRILGTP